MNRDHSEHDANRPDRNAHVVVDLLHRDVRAVQARVRRLGGVLIGLALVVTSVFAGGCASNGGAAYRTTELTSATTSSDEEKDGAVSGGPSGEERAPKVGKPERSFDLDDSSDDTVAPKRPTPSRRSGTFGNWK